MFYSPAQWAASVADPNNWRVINVSKLVVSKLVIINRITARAALSDSGYDLRSAWIWQSEELLRPSSADVEQIHRIDSNSRGQNPLTIVFAHKPTIAFESSNCATSNLLPWTFKRSKCCTSLPCYQELNRARLLGHGGR